jgi:hypothetical protein
MPENQNPATAETAVTENTVNDVETAPPAAFSDAQPTEAPQTEAPKTV